MLRAAILCSGIVLLVRGQSQGGAFNNNLLCNGSFSQANATGFFSYNPHVSQGQQQGQPDNHSGKTQPLQLVYSVTQNLNDSRIQASTWISTNGANYSNDFQLGYDVCGMNFAPVLENTMLRGQSDNGSCLSMFNADCVNAIELAAQQQADIFTTPSPPPNSNLTSTSLPTVCNDIAKSLTSILPTLSECKPFFNSSVQVGEPTALSGYNTSFETDNYCKANGSYYEVETLYIDFSEDLYAIYTQGVTPILAIWMPIANAARPSTIIEAVAGLVCTRIKSFKEGSVVPAALPAPTSIKEGGDGGGLSGGAIAGVVIGVLVGVGLIVGAAVWFFFRRRKAKKAQQESGLYEKVQNEAGVVDISGNAARAEQDAKPAELPPNSVAPAQELDGAKDKQLHELASEQLEAKELQGTEQQAPVVELEGSAPASNLKS